MEADQSIQEFLEFVIGGLIQHGDRATIARRRDDRGSLLFDVTLDQTDVGRIIGKNGHVISALRSLLDASGEKHGMRVRMKLLTVDESGRTRAVED